MAAAIMAASTATCGAVGPAGAVPRPPAADVVRNPADPRPGPEFSMRRTNSACARAGVIPNSDFSQIPPPSTALNLAGAWEVTRGAGVRVAVIDTGVTPQSRLPGLTGGGDYMSDRGTGLEDCDAHGTLVAGIIAAAPSDSDSFAGVAPDARIISIRQSSDAFTAELPNGSNPNDPRLSKNAMDVRSLARAVVHAANLNAGVINISVTACLGGDGSVDLSPLASALRYAADVKDAVVVASAGNTGDREGCSQNPDVNPATPDDPRNWSGASTVSVPSVFDKYVVSVGFTSPDGQPSKNSLAGPWVDLGAPGTAIVSLSPTGRGVVDGVYGQNGLSPLAGSSFAAAYVSGVAALLRAKFPDLSRSAIEERMTATAHAPARGVNNVIGSGFIDPVAALTDSDPVSVPAAQASSGKLIIPAADRPADSTPGIAAAIGVGVVGLIAVAVVAAVVISRGGRRER